MQKERDRRYRRDHMQEDKDKRGRKKVDSATRTPKHEAYQRNRRNAVRAELNAGLWL